MAIDTTAPRSRRALLAAAAGATAATAVQAIARPLPAQATSDYVSYVNDEDGSDVIQGFSLRQDGFPGSGSGTGVLGYSFSGKGVYGIGVSGYGVHATSGSNNAIRAETDTTDAIFGSSNSQGGVYGASGSGDGVGGYSNSGTGVKGSSGGTAPGVAGVSAGGRGGQFQGKKAQVRLLPSTAATHPSSGALGDLFVDANRRLWFCKGGTNWKQLA